MAGMRLEVRNSANFSGRVIYDDDVALAGHIGGDIYILECAGRSIEFDAHLLPEAMMALKRHTGGALSLMEASQAILEDIAERMPADAS